ncbi:hypothetical protein IGI37_003756 [Enterococcus sp. AZ194]|uniref:PTS sugar transporter subunit IIB n=1 Tax=Enterococcus sp. AZ194 TaxID=2774629 RepID=UPI003F212449
MKKSILIICEAGITASSLLYKIAQELDERKINIDVSYVSFSGLEEKMKQKKYDVLLLTPQIRRHAKIAQQLLDKYSKGAEVLMISDHDFLYMNIPHIVQQIQGENK